MSPGNNQGPLAEVKAKPAPTPDASGNAPAPLPADEPVALTAGEGFVALPPVGEPPASEVEKNGPGHEADLAPAPAPDPVLSPVMELAGADVKPGTPPDPAHPPAPAIPPASAPAVESPTAVAAPAPVAVPSPLSSAGPLDEAVAHGGDMSVKEATDTAGHAELGTAAAAMIAGSAAFGHGAALSAATALSAGAHDQAKPNDKQISSVQPAPAPATLPPPAPAPATLPPPAPAPATLPPPAPASASPPVKTGEPKPPAGDPAPASHCGS